MHDILTVLFLLKLLLTFLSLFISANLFAFINEWSENNDCRKFQQIRKEGANDEEFIDNNVHSFISSATNKQY